MTNPTIDALQDLRQRVLAHDAKVKLGEADASAPPYTIEELKDAIAAISANRAAIAQRQAAKTPKTKRTPSKSIDLDDLI